ncbi:MAG: hypothetical protein ACR2G7_00315 [Acidimicrobiales bacterium]
MDRLSDKDAADVYRIMQTASPTELGATPGDLRRHPVAGGVAVGAMTLLDDLFGTRRGQAIPMAQRALALAIDPDQITTVCIAFTAALIDAAS